MPKGLFSRKVPDPADRYIYTAIPVRVIDGDNVVFTVRLGFHFLWGEQSFRLVGINSRELSQPGGEEARLNLEAIFAINPRVTICSIKPDKYGDRWLADVTLMDGQRLGPLLIATGWAAPWDGRGTKPIPPWPRSS